MKRMRILHPFFRRPRQRAFEKPKVCLRMWKTCSTWALTLAFLRSEPQEGAAHHEEVRHRVGEEAQEALRPDRPGREPKVAPNAVDRDFRRGAPLKAVSTDIACLPCMDEGFVCMSGIPDCQTDVLLARKCSISMEERLVLDTYDQLRELVLPDDIWACSDRGAHHAARACRDRPREPGIRQSMSRRACCRDNACIGSFWGRMEGQMGDAAHLPPGAMAPAGRYADRCSDRRGQERPGWLTPMEHAGRLAAWQCAEIGVHLRMPPEGYLRW